MAEAQGWYALQMTALTGMNIVVAMMKRTYSPFYAPASQQLPCWHPK